jgi:predicted acyltransferase
MPHFLSAENRDAMTNPASTYTPVRRLLSLDVVRGITIAFMIMVNNNGGSGSWRLMNHAAWNGLTPTDLVFPTFLFVVGASIVFAFDARLARGASRAELTWHTLRRAGILFLLGIAVNSFPFFKLDHLRFYGVLQRIAICYLAVGIFYLWDRRLWTKIAVLAASLAGYWVLLRWVPVPGSGVPGRDIPFLDPDQNIVAWLDRHLMPGHLYEDWTTHSLCDPEGLLSDIPAVATALLGLLAGMWLRGRMAAAEKTKGLAVACIGLLACGYVWSVWFPLNKKLWTSSYVLVAAGWSLALLMLAYWAVEQQGWFKGRSKVWIWPWLVFGSNAIVAYMISELLPGILDNIAIPVGSRHKSLQVYLSSPIFAHISDPGWAAFAFSVSFTTVCFLPVWALYRKNIFVKV